jgi:membrane protease YdiL (CAAX protease family)
LLFFFVGAYAWTWSFNLMKILSQRDIVSTPIPYIVLDIAAGLGPLVAALVVVSYILLVGGGLDEELGWRGYAFPRLQKRHGALIASVILGVIWAGWHIPAWYMQGSGQDMISFPVFVVSTTAAAIVFAWLYNSTGGSLLLVILAHTVFDLCTTGPWAHALLKFPPEQRGLDPFNILTVVGLAIAVGVVLVTDRRTLTLRP